MRQSPTYIDAKSAKVGDHVRFHARGRFRTGTVLEVKGVRAKVSFYVEPSRWDSIGHREQWIRFNVPEVGDAKTNAVRKAKAKITRLHKHIALEEERAASGTWGDNSQYLRNLKARLVKAEQELAAQQG